MWPEVVMENHTRTSAVHGKSHTTTKKKNYEEMSVRQTLGISLESKMVQKLSLEKKLCNKKWSPKLTFLDEFFF